VKSLTARRDLETLEQQIEALRGSRRAAWSRVERAAREGEAEHEDRGNPGPSGRESTELSFGCRVQVIAQMTRAVFAREHFETFAELPYRRLDE
jgi:hypothetical protein